MKFKCEKMLKSIATNVYLMEYNTKKDIFENIEFIHFTPWSKWDKHYLENPQNLLKNILPEDIPLVLEKIKELKEKDYVTFVYRFVTKDKKIQFIKPHLSVFERKDHKIYIIGYSEKVTQEKEYEIIVETIKQSPHIGILIFQEKILYVNEYMKKLLDFEIGGKMTDYVHDIPKKELLSMINKRKSGERFFIYRKALKFVNKKRIFVDAFVQTILFKGEYCGLALVTDVTSYEKIKIIDNIISQISDTLFSNTTKKAFLQDVKETIEKYGYKVYIEYDDIKLGEKIKFHNEIIYNDKKGEFKSFLNLKLLNKGKMVIYCKYYDEFEYKFLDNYLELQKAINFSLINIKHNMLMTILQEAIDKSYQWVIITDKDGKIVYANDTVSNLSGYEKRIILGKTPKIFKSNYHDKEFYKKLWQTISKGEVFEDIFVEKNKEGKLFYLRLKIIPITINDERYYVSLGIDITKEKELQSSLLTDEVTKLPNRKGFLIEANKKLEDNTVLLLIDIRNFKALNQVKGYFYGDLILKEFSEFLKTFFYEEDLIAKIGGDEFAVLLKIDSISKIIKIVEKLIKKAKKIENMDLNVGIAFYPKDAHDINSLLEKSFAALEYAKREGSGVYKFYNENIKEEIEFLLNAKSLISKALKKDKFLYYFQPYYSIKEDKIVGYEALLRIVDNDKIITPYYFIDYAEESGIIKEIEEHMYKKLPLIYEQLKTPFSVNLSLSSFNSDKHVKKLLSYIKNLPLGIELTEREVAKDINLTKNILKIIKEFNLKISIDDFGTGYSSFLYIKELEFDVLKIDMSFIKNIHTSEKDLALVKTLVTLAKELNLTTIAEGVEYKEQLELLKEMGCDIAQGYLIAKPMPIDEAIEFKNNFKGLK